MQPRQNHPAPAATTPPAPRGRTAAVAVPLLLGLVLGAGGVGAAWALTSGSGTPAAGTPAADARAACRALEGFDEAKYVDRGPAGETAVNRYAAAGTLSAAAAAGDPAYKELAETIRRSQDRHQQVFDFDATVRKDLARARALCADL
ncbi:hypothetical protein [Streptomyces omiyaensis]|uniref:Secreted protein n=1 Tax=Streptomyces omiyaensis TaxID=68247 RepID=A0ABW7C5S7_9ACTN|nr:hypothetical protein [Streptomyces omiyaensis]GGY50417.1 hypothetical protein GCM10010363_34180 [Streptomyces omiyaensis]